MNDLFMNSFIVLLFSYDSEKQIGIRLAYSLMIEEYPKSAEFIVELPDETDNNEGKAPKYWLLSMDVASYLGIARFVLGLYSHIEIIDSPGFQDFINEEIRKMYHRSL